MENQHLLPLKTKLQSFGALRPEAWAAIVLAKQEIKLKPEESLIRKEGTLAYLADGLMKEYNPQNRSKPALINFIGSQQSIITRKHNQNHYLKAISPCLVYSWDFEQLQQLYNAFKELKPIYDSLCSEYDQSTAFRQLILEERYAPNRIKLFLSKYKSLLPLLKKKDVANYLQMTYNHFIETYNHLL